ncbi:MAG: hypothetical protein AAF490_10560 [Chloroflexota bacterium]
MNPQTQMTLYFLATLAGIGLFIFELSGRSASPSWIGYMWGVYSVAFAFLTYSTWKKTRSE